MVKIAPSLLSANFADMKSGIEIMEKANVDYLHCDVMDGVFVPNISFGFKMIKDIDNTTNIPLDVHLMIIEPERYAQRFVECGADIVTIHVEATNHVQRTLAVIKEAGAKAGVVLNPATPLDTVKYILDDVDMILLMSVNPGFGGQKFIPAVLNKIRDLRTLIDESGRNIDIEVDGGVSPKNAKELADAGATVLVAGSAVFDALDPIKTVNEMRV